VVLQVNNSAVDYLKTTTVAFGPKYRTNWKEEGREEMDIAPSNMALLGRLSYVQERQ
jgi:hypothetical protein